ncbi:MAG TPA: hypothetical protein VGH94_08345 [Acidimicrobiales bacterium]|jgi:hypothetical protein
MGFPPYQGGSRIHSVAAVADETSRGFLAECFWPGVTESALRDLDERIQTSAERMARSGEDVRYLGSVLMVEDEVVLCRFEGAQPAVRRAAEQASVPFDRIVASASSPWTSAGPDEDERGTDQPS